MAHHAALIMAGFAASVSLLARHWKAILAWQAAQTDAANDARQPLLPQARTYSPLRDMSALSQICCPL
jgi:hypothetical protein